MDGEEMEVTARSGGGGAEEGALAVDWGTETPRRKADVVAPALLAVHSRSQILALGVGAALRVVDLQSQLPIRQQVEGGSAHADAIRAVCFDSSGQLLASAGDDKNVCIWRIQASHDKHSRGGQAADPPGAAVRASESAVDGFSEPEDKAACDAHDVSPQWAMECVKITRSPKKVSAAAFTKDSRYLLFADKFGIVYATDCHSLLGQNGAQSVVQTSTSSGAVTPQTLSGLPKKTSLPSKLGTADAAFLLGHCSSIITALAVSGDGTLVATADRDFKVRVSRLPRLISDSGAPEIISYCLGHTAFVTSLNFLGGSQEEPSNSCQAPHGHLLSSGGDGKLCLWDPLTGSCLSSVHLYTVIESKGVQNLGPVSGEAKEAAVTSSVKRECSKTEGSIAVEDIMIDDGAAVHGDFVKPSELSANIVGDPIGVWECQTALVPSSSRGICAAIAERCEGLFLFLYDGEKASLSFMQLGSLGLLPGCQGSQSAACFGSSGPAGQGGQEASSAAPANVEGIRVNAVRNQRRRGASRRCRSEAAVFSVSSAPGWSTPPGSLRWATAAAALVSGLRQSCHSVPRLFFWDGHGMDCDSKRLALSFPPTAVAFTSPSRLWAVGGGAAVLPSSDAPVSPAAAAAAKKEAQQIAAQAPVCLQEVVAKRGGGQVDVDQSSEWRCVALEDLRQRWGSAGGMQFLLRWDADAQVGQKLVAVTKSSIAAQLAFREEMSKREYTEEERDFRKRRRNDKKPKGK